MECQENYYGCINQRRSLSGFCIENKIKRKLKKMGKSIIPEEIKNEIIKIINEYNDLVYSHSKSVHYIPEFRGKILYLKRREISGHISPIARLTYKGKKDKWDFAIYKWSTESYDPEEWLFPGREFVDGTISGALKAGDKAYPIGY